MTSQEFNIAVVLAAGKGKRMAIDTPKQYLHLFGHPIIWYSLKACEEDPQINAVILVCGPDETEYCRERIVKPYRFQKVAAVIEGGAERYDSVWRALQEIRRQKEAGLIPACTYVLVHDGARPLLNAQILGRCLEGVREHGACAAGMPAKDTIKICDEKGTVLQTPDRAALWTVQTPQTFEYDLLYGAYRKMYENLPQGITDDAMVVEQMTDHKVTMIMGSYRNIKITTPEDMELAKAYLADENENLTTREDIAHERV